MFELIGSSDARGLVQDWLVFFVCGGALIWGAAPERAVASVWLIVFTLSGYLTDYFFGASMQMRSVDPFSASRDLVAGMCWIGIALYANRNYTLWIAGMQVLAMFGHLSRGLSELMSPIAYAIMTAGPGWMQLILLGIGLIRHIRRKRKYGKYRDWRTSRSTQPAGLTKLHQTPQHDPLRPGTGSWRDELK